jgi:dihydrofolate reductase
MDQNGTIGKDGDLPWRLPADLKHFKAQTTGKTILMGRVTWDSIGRPLPSRKNVVLSSKKITLPDEVLLFDSLESASAQLITDDVMLIGGAQIYTAALKLGWIEKIILTRVLAEVNGDTRLDLPFEQFNKIDQQSRPADEKNAFELSFEEYLKK